MSFNRKNKAYHPNNNQDSLKQFIIDSHEENGLTCSPSTLEKIVDDQRQRYIETKVNRIVDNQHRKNTSFGYRIPLASSKNSQLQIVDELESEENCTSQVIHSINVSPRKSIGINERTPIKNSQGINSNSQRLLSQVAPSINVSSRKSNGIIERTPIKNSQGNNSISQGSNPNSQGYNSASQHDNPNGQHFQSQPNRLSLSIKKSEPNSSQQISNSASKENFYPNQRGLYTPSPTKVNRNSQNNSQQQRPSLNSHHNSPNVAQRLDELNFVDESTNLWTWYGYIVYILLFLCSILLCVSMMYRNYRYKLKTSYVVYNVRFNITLVYLLVTLVSSIF